jgi:hypothetical protein
LSDQQIVLDNGDCDHHMYGVAVIIERHS